MAQLEIANINRNLSGSFLPRSTPRRIAMRPKSTPRKTRKSWPSDTAAAELAAVSQVCLRGSF